jgi:hypothetical protein
MLSSVSSHVHGDPPAPPPLDDEERAFRESLEKMVDFVRVEPPKLFLRAFLPAFVLVAVGGHLVAGSFAYSESAPQRGLFLLLAGIVVIACGPSWALFWLIRSMKRDVYVAMRVDGLCVRLDPRLPERVLAWDALHEVHVDPDTGQIRVELTTGEQLPLPGPFSGVTNPQLAARIRDARRLAVWHRLAPRPR